MNKKVGMVLPKRWRKKAKELLMYAGLKTTAEDWLGKRLVWSIIIAVVIPILLFLMNWMSIGYSILIGIILFLVSLFSSFLILSLKADKRAREIEKVLPSALQLIAANIRAGMTPDRAIWTSARPEFGAFEEEIKQVGSETLTGTPISKAFLNMKDRVRSRMLKRTVLLLVEGIESGGELAKLLSGTANEIKSLELLQKEMNANVAMYTMFVTFASVVGAPLLFGISTFFVDLLSEMSMTLGLGNIAQEAMKEGIGMMTFSTNITPDFLLRFSIVVISITTFFASLLVGLIKRGDEKQGFRFVPLFLIGGLLVFFLVKYAIASMFGSMIGF